VKILLNKPVAPCLKTLSGYLEQVNQSGWYTNFGPLHQKLTHRLEEYLGVKNLLLVSNGTLALHIAYRALNIKNTICTPFSFAATASSLAWEKIPFSFVDIDSESLNLSPSLVVDKLGKNSDIDSVVTTHVYGNSCDVEAFEKIKTETGVKVVYDASHAFGVNYAEQSVLNYGDASTLSFHATKVFHTIEGGAIVFREKEVYERAKKIINFGFDETGKPTLVGINAKLNEYQAAVGLTLLDTIDEILEHRSKLFELYRQSLSGYVSMPDWSEGSSVNGAYLPIILKDETEKNRMKVALEKSGIPSREYFSPSLNTVFNPQDLCPVSESMSSRVLCLPLHYYLTHDNVKYIADSVKGARV
jgi:dTDP-4-amino-4,6-dideoxygalactose transaminase